MERLETKRLILRSLKLNDLDDFYSYAKKPHIGPQAGWQPHQSEMESLKILQMMMKDEEVWAIELKENQKMIGTIGLHVRNFDNAILNRKELGYVLNDTYWGFGYMTEAVLSVLDYAFKVMELDEVLCGHKILNEKSKNVILRTGFCFTHDEDRPFYDGTIQKIMMYQLKKDQYLKGKNI